TPANGLVLAGTGCTVNGLTIRGFKGDGILVLGADNILGDWPLGITLVQNEGYGARLSGASATGNQMDRAHVGVLDGADEPGHGNGAGGVLIEGGASDNSIGSHTVKVSGNGGHGLSLVGNATRGNRVHTGDFGTPELGNEGHGIYVDGAKNSWLNPHGVSGNGGDGVHITGDSAGIQLDQVHGGLMDNGGLGINLVGDDTGDYGVTLNDTGDFDEGPNGLLNYPVVTAINDSGGGGGGVFFLEGTACTYCSVHIYQATDHPSGHGEAESLLGTAWSDDNGYWEYQIQPGFPFGLPLTDLTITTTATDCVEGEACQHGPSTSELSPNVSAEDFVQICGDGDLDPGEACDDGNVNNGDGCSALCQEELCGDGIVQEGLGEQCDGENTPLCWWWD
ncbi:MAG: right-handed parallel beta-helix repeat-containing protein, partial [Myxococcota bacterium]|nr:right-handed parallel beta-helix repeat-containing protein [Myxococcota bacterium]